MIQTRNQRRCFCLYSSSSVCLSGTAALNIVRGLARSATIFTNPRHNTGVVLLKEGRSRGDRVLGLRRCI
ncbi:unnamed protein product [Ixodes pacificus]